MTAPPSFAVARRGGLALAVFPGLASFTAASAFAAAGAGAAGLAAGALPHVDVVDRELLPRHGAASPAQPPSGRASQAPPRPPELTRADGAAPGSAATAPALARAPVPGDELRPGDLLRSGDRVAVRVELAAPLPHSAVTLAEGGSVLRALPSLGDAPRFRLEAGAALATLHAPPRKAEPALKSKPAPGSKPVMAPKPPPFIAYFETAGVFVGCRLPGKVLLLAPGAEGEDEPAAVYAMGAELEVATSFDTLQKGEGMRVPSGHAVLVQGPDGIESPRPFESEHDILARYPGMNRIRSNVFRN